MHWIKNNKQEIQFLWVERKMSLVVPWRHQSRAWKSSFPNSNNSKQDLVFIFWETIFCSILLLKFRLNQTWTHEEFNLKVIETGPRALFFSLFGQTQCAIDVPWKGSPALPFALFCNRNRCHWIARTNKILVLTLTEIVFEISRKMSLVVPWRHQSRGQISRSWNVLTFAFF